MLLYIFIFFYVSFLKDKHSFYLILNREKEENASKRN